MILLNAVYFKARWAKPFDKDMTQLSYFVADDDTVKTVITMVSCDEYDYGYLSEFHARFIILPYEVYKFMLFCTYKGRASDWPKLSGHIWNTTKTSRITYINIFLFHGP